MREFILNGLTKKQCEQIKNVFSGKSIYEFEISYSYFGANNCSLIVRPSRPNVRKDEMRNEFMCCLIRYIDYISHKEG